MLKGKNLSKELWGEAISITAYLLNKCPTKKRESVMLEEAWSGFKSNMDHLRVFALLQITHLTLTAKCI